MKIKNVEEFQFSYKLNYTFNKEYLHVIKSFENLKKLTIRLDMAIKENNFTFEEIKELIVGKKRGFQLKIPKQ